MSVGRALLAALVLAPCGMLRAVDSVEALQKAIEGLAPGATITVADGTYTTKQAFKLEGKRGTAEAPITIRAEHRGKAIIAGHAGFVLKDCEHVVLEGFVFENDANQSGVLLDDCRHVRITRCVFRLNESAKPKWGQQWVYAIGKRSGYNRVDHNRFERKTHRGSPVFLCGDDKALAPTQHDRVDHNHFIDIIDAKGANGHETLRTGDNNIGASGKSTFTIIEHNLLERCSGEQEILSLKSSGNIVRHNTFIDCRGAICLRLGNRSEVHGNMMVNPGGVAGAGGVKIYGYEHRVHDNYFRGLTGEGHESPLVLAPGAFDTETTDQILEKYRDFTTTPATRVTITRNTWIDCSPLYIGQKKPDKELKFLPQNCTFTHNTIAHGAQMKTPLIKLGLVRDLAAADNIAQSAKVSAGPWAVWFKWEQAAGAVGVSQPKMISPEAVGPNAKSD